MYLCSDPRSWSGSRRRVPFVFWQRGATLWAGMVACLLLASSSGAVGMAYTLIAPVPFTIGSTSGTLNPVLPTTMAGTIDLSLGSTDFSANDGFIFSISVTAGSVDELGATVLSTNFMTNPLGVGTYTGAGNPAASVVFDNTAFTNTSTWNFTGNQVDAGETSVNLFVTIGPAGDLEIGDMVSFRVSAGLDTTVFGLVIPEPATAALMGCGLAALTFAGRRRRA